MDTEVLILGSGPAGLSAAIYTARGGLGTHVISHGRSPLKWAGRIENYMGFPEGVEGSELLERSVRQAVKFGAGFAEDEIVSIDASGSDVMLKGAKSSYTGKVLLLATGNPPVRTSLKNAERFEGKGIAYCPTCDGFFYRGLKVGVLGFKDFAADMAMELTDYTGDITIYTNGRQPVFSEKYAAAAQKFRINTDAIARLEGNAFLESIEFSNGTSEKTDGLFIASGSASSADFAAKTGITTKGNLIVVDEDQKTNLDRVFAAGACTTNCRGVNQIATSVGQGALAGKKMLEYLGRSSADHYNIRKRPD